MATSRIRTLLVALVILPLLWTGTFCVYSALGAVAYSSGGWIMQVLLYCVLLALAAAMYLIPLLYLLRPAACQAYETRIRAAFFVEASILALLTLTPHSTIRLFSSSLKGW